MFWIFCVSHSGGEPILVCCHELTLAGFVRVLAAMSVAVVKRFREFFLASLVALSTVLFLLLGLALAFAPLAFAGG